MTMLLTHPVTRATQAAALSLVKTELAGLPLKQVLSAIAIDMIEALPQKLSKAITGLTTTEHALLRKKQRWLEQYVVEAPDNADCLKAAVDATLVFAQDRCGTAICIAREGLLLTCSHCIAESEEEYSAGQERDVVQWLVFASGRVVKTRCVAWDEIMDLALLEIVAAQDLPLRSAAAAPSAPLSAMQAGTREEPVVLDDSIIDAHDEVKFPAIMQANPETRLALNKRLICIGHPGSEDLEVDEPGVKTNYDIIHVSEGRFRGFAKDQSRFDNSEIGALKHDCWTYWGHSGAPLVDRISGELVGLHSSWDDETGMRRGIGIDAIARFFHDYHTSRGS